MSTTKKAFDLSRNSIYVASPNELCIIGGKVLSKDERGPLDTDHKKGEHELWDERLESVQVTDAEVANIDFYGVLKPITIAKDADTGLPVVVDGRSTVRRARRANLLRVKRGEPEITIECKVIRSTGNRLIGAMIAANQIRQDDGPIVLLEKAKRLMERGVSEADAAMTFGLDVEYFRQLLAYDDAAVSDVKSAVAGGELSATAAVEMVRTAKTPEAQRTALANVRANAKAGKPASVRTAINAAKAATGKIDDKGAGLIPSRRELGRVLKAVLEYTDSGATVEADTLLKDDTGKSGIDPEQKHVVDAYYLGIKAALDLTFGRCKDRELLQMLARARKEMAK